MADQFTSTHKVRLDGSDGSTVVIPLHQSNGRFYTRDEWGLVTDPVWTVEAGPTPGSASRLLLRGERPTTIPGTETPVSQCVLYSYSDGKAIAG